MAEMPACPPELSFAKTFGRTGNARIGEWPPAKGTCHSETSSLTVKNRLVDPLAQRVRRGP